MKRVVTILIGWLFLAIGWITLKINSELSLALFIISIETFLISFFIEKIKFNIHKRNEIHIIPSIIYFRNNFNKKRRDLTIIFLKYSLVIKF